MRRGMEESEDAGSATWNSVVSSSGPELERLIADVVSGMTLDEKIGQMSGSSSLAKLLVMAVRYGWRTFDSGENRRLGIPAIAFTDGPRGVCLNRSTCFPVEMARGATWDPELQGRVGNVIGIEARSQGANFYGGVCINVLRHPGWGRAQETYGEDPHHLGIMGVAMVQGVQRHLMACVKHFACNSIEESRFFVDVLIDERTLREVYLPHFRKCVDAGVASVMSAYNKVNGTYCGHNVHLLREILKEEWGFDGFVVSDFVYGVRDGRAGVTGGLDVEMPKKWRLGRGFKRAVLRGEVPVEVIDGAVRRILRQKAAFATVGENGAYGKDRVACREHTELALEVARKSVVLLKNDNGTLPFRGEGVSKIAVIGALADRENIGDRGSSRVWPPFVVTPLEGIRNRAGGSVEVEYQGGEDLSLARRAAREADAVVVVAGLTYREEGEFLSKLHPMGGDREDLGLPAGQRDLIAAVARENDRCVVVLEGGSAITMESWRDMVPAVLMAWYPGMEGGNAIAEIIFGEVNPSGKLPFAWPKSTAGLPRFDKKAKSIEYGYYHGYRLFDRTGLEPAFAFAFGLSYTQYACGNLRLGASRIGKTGKLNVEVDVTNTGEMSGEEIVQMYVGPVGSAVDRPVRELKGFARVALKPGETKTVSMELKPEDLSYYDVERGAWYVEEIEYTVYVGSSSRPEDLRLSDSFTVSGP